MAPQPYSQFFESSLETANAAATLLPSIKNKTSKKLLTEYLLCTRTKQHKTIQKKLVYLHACTYNYICQSSSNSSSKSSTPETMLDLKKHLLSLVLSIQLFIPPKASYCFMLQYFNILPPPPTYKRRFSFILSIW